MTASAPPEVETDGRDSIYGERGLSLYPRPEPATIRLRREIWRVELARLHIASDQELATRLGFTPTTIWRIRCDENAPSSRFMAQATRLFGRSLDDLFEVVAEQVAA